VSSPQFSVVVPSRGERAKLANLLDALEHQTLPREHFEIILALDRAELPPDLAARVAAIGVRTVRRPVRSGPGAARNCGAAEARGEFIAFTEDDVTPAPDWLERALAHLNADPPLDVLEGSTTKPGGRSVRKLDAGGHAWLPTNLFVRRSLFERVGGYHEGFFDPANGVYFREDSDFGFTLEEAGARISRAPEARVEHPDEHPGYLDPLRWAQRYEMDALLAARHPRLFRERIEVHRLGPFRVRRPIVRAAWVVVLAIVAALVSAVAGRREMAPPFLLLAGAAFLPVWAKWRFAPLRLPVLVLVPFVLVDALVRGWFRARSLLRVGGRQ
jgi:glycosyltransferase involved in cell wall biosynthesis